MDLFDAIRQRRSIKSFDPRHEMTDDEIDTLMRLAIESPTSFNIQNWRFVVVKEKANKAALRAASFNQAQVEEASITICLCADLDAWGAQPERYWRDAPPAVAAQLVPMITGLYGKDSQLQRDEAIRSIGIAAQTIMLAAKGMGYDTCPMIGFVPDLVGKVIHLPPRHLVGMLITVGKALKPAWPKPGQLALEDVVCRERFPEG